jgi:glycosyltransferase involved in cell wall biosynthesis
VLTGYVQEDELVKIIGAACGLIYPSLWEGFGVPVLEAMQCDVPVITSSGSSMQEIAKDAALYADATSYTDIADKMMQLYKDESLRKQLIGKGREVAKQYNWDQVADRLWRSIVKACG